MEIKILILITMLFLFVSCVPQKGEEEATGLLTNTLWKVSCIAENDCWLVGGSNIAHNKTGNDTDFTVVNNPFYDGRDGFVTTVFCNSSTDCWLGGSNANNNWSLARNTTGTDNGFYLVPSPFGKSAVSSIYCTSSTNCWAVGEDGKIAYNGTGENDGWNLIELDFL